MPGGKTIISIVEKDKLLILAVIILNYQKLNGVEMKLKLLVIKNRATFCRYIENRMDPLTAVFTCRGSC